MNHRQLLDNNLYEVIDKCTIRNRTKDISEIIVTYTNGNQERIWTYNNNRYYYDKYDFIGKTKIEAIFHCDRQRPYRY